MKCYLFIICVLCDKKIYNVVKLSLEVQNLEYNKLLSFSFKYEPLNTRHLNLIISTLFRHVHVIFVSLGRHIAI